MCIYIVRYHNVYHIAYIYIYCYTFELAISLHMSRIVFEKNMRLYNCVRFYVSVNIDDNCIIHVYRFQCLVSKTIDRTEITRYILKKNIYMYMYIIAQMYVMHDIIQTVLLMPRPKNDITKPIRRDLRKPVVVMTLYVRVSLSLSVCPGVCPREEKQR